MRFLIVQCGSLHLCLFLVLFLGDSFNSVLFFLILKLVFLLFFVISYCIIAYYYIIFPKKPVHFIRDREWVDPYVRSWGVTGMNRGRSNHN